MVLTVTLCSNTAVACVCVCFVLMGRVARGNRHAAFLHISTHNPFMNLRGRWIWVRWYQNIAPLHIKSKIIKNIYIIVSSCIHVFLGDVTVQPGTYNYNFQCSLPSGLPTSLEATIGHIRYMVRVVMDIPMWVDTEFVEVFTVIKPLNLNYSEELRVSVTAPPKPQTWNRKKKFPIFSRFYGCWYVCVPS